MSPFVVFNEDPEEERGKWGYTIIIFLAEVVFQIPSFIPTLPLIPFPVKGM